MYIRVHVFPEAKREAVHQIKQDTFEIHVKEKPERGLANKRVTTLLARACRVPSKHVRIISGHHSRTKIFSVEPSIHDTN